MNFQFANPGELVKAFFKEVWHEPHNLDAIDDFMTEDYVITSGGQIIRGREAFKEWVKQFQVVLQDAKTESVEEFWNANEDMVVSRWVCSGRNNGIFGLPPDGRDVTFTGIAIWKIRNGQLKECWVERSALEAYRKLAAPSGTK